MKDVRCEMRASCQISVSQRQTRCRIKEESRTVTKGDAASAIKAERMPHGKETDESLQNKDWEAFEDMLWILSCPTLLRLLREASQTMASSGLRGDEQGVVH